MQKKIIIGLIGEKGSGKGTVAKHLINNYGAAHFGTSAILKRTVEDLRLPATRDNLIKLALILKNGFWPSVVMDSLIAEMEESDAQIIIADGIRMHGDVEPFRKKYGKDFYMIYVTADVKTRYERTRARKEKIGEDQTTFEQFLAEEGRLTEVSIHEIGDQADYKISNDQGLEKLLEQIEEIMADIKK